MKRAIILTGVLLGMFFLMGCPPTHEFECQCKCAATDVTLQPEAGKNCKEFDGTECDIGDASSQHKLSDCKKVAVPKEDE